MPNIKMILEYDGTRFHGWQKQPGLKTVQGELHKALELVLREPIKEVIASGRTDAGVHAKGQVANFHTISHPDLDRLQRSVSSILKGELSVVQVEIVSDEFHSRYCAAAKEYRYTILNRYVPAVLDWNRAWLVSAKLDEDAMRQFALSLCGTRDFACFQASGCEARSTIKTIYKSEIKREDDYLIYTVIGSGFLKQMVRNIVGTLVEIGRGSSKIPPIESLLNSRNRQLAGITAPAYGLMLHQVFYEEI
ncbi:MAG: tRNA pseudouridine(38-40) synthase TruA [Bdellovibrionales bacterium]|nr:tRNA pseudouridine(38-40) synthase TruA [Bdellovibrionales bacterium]